ncbi:chaperone modulator CbpM [Solirhodobacter olei]|uniref:chaperone modulator CbpM n=1 Tax=Solirhodobacter olei TaxID=2493082 RepID=UPI000FD87920|nr:chaperone modulator CbpM [Solirhodobacter olei]
MSEHLTSEEILTAVPRLTRLRLEAWVGARVVSPVETAGGRGFRQVDVARLTLACELSDEFELADDALALVLDLVDRLHRAEAELDALAEILAGEPEAVRRRIGDALAARM